MTKSKRPEVEQVTFVRTHTEARVVPIFLFGSSRWLRDIELLLEDEWKQLRVVTTDAEYHKAVSTGTPGVAIVEVGAFGKEEARIVEALLPPQVRKLLVAPDGADQLAVKRLQRKLAPAGVSLVNLSSDSRTASTELAELLDNVLATRAATTDSERDLVRSAFGGYCSTGRSREDAVQDERRLTVVRHLLSKFTLPVDITEDALLLVETSALWKAPVKPADLQVAFRHVEDRVNASAAGPLVKLALTSAEAFETKGDLSAATWEQLVAEAKLSKVAARQIVRSHGEVIAKLAAKKKGLRSVA